MCYGLFCLHSVVSGVIGFKFRWWVACHANHIAMASVSDNILQQVKEEVQKLRSTLRYCVAALSDYKYDPEDFQHTRLTDRYVLHLLAGFHQQAS